MNLLAGIYSGGNKLKRLLGDFVADPVGVVTQRVNQINDDAGKLNRLTALAAQERVANMPTGAMGPNQNKLAQLLADSYNPAGMVVWHGSPHKFSKFDSSKIGTGEGAQAYGHGLYFAESPDVAKGYQATLAQQQKPNLTEQRISSFYEKTGDWETAVDDFLRGVYVSPKEKAKMRDMWIKKGPVTKVDGGALYKVDLPDDAIAKMLDWDKPLSQQAPEVKDAINRVGRSPEPYGLERVADDMRMVEMQKLFQSREGVEALRQHGIPGIRYLDGGSRGAGSGTSNFVVFPGNEGLLTILERNGQPLK